MRQLISICAVAALYVSLTACSPEVGSEKWCANLKGKPKGDWSTNEAKDYLKHCVIE